MLTIFLAELIRLLVNELHPFVTILIQAFLEADNAKTEGFRLGLVRPVFRGFFASPAGNNQ